MDHVWIALLSEFLGTFTLVFIGAGAAALTLSQGGSLVGTALAFGLALAAIIYVWGSYSGGHFNPAVSFGAALVGRMSWGTMLAYWCVQLLGGIAAAALIAWFFGTASGVGASVGSLTYTDQIKAVLVEALITFFLVFTILMVTKNAMYSLVAGLIIGMVLTFDILVAGPLTGGSANPARSLGPALFSGNISSYWIYVVGPLLGALAAGLLFKAMDTCWAASPCPKLLRGPCNLVEGQVLEPVETKIPVYPPKEVKEHVVAGFSPLVVNMC